MMSSAEVQDMLEKALKRGRVAGLKEALDVAASSGDGKAVEAIRNHLRYVDDPDGPPASLPEAP